MKSNRKAIWFLGVLVLGVWGAVAYQILTTVGAGEGIEPAGASSSREKPGGGTQSYMYAADTRDPFQYIPPAMKDDTSRYRVKPKSAPPPEPALRLTGIVEGKLGKVAVVEDAKGQVVFMAPGDTLQGVRVLKIEKGVVKYSFKKTRGEWNLTDHQDLR